MVVDQVNSFLREVEFAKSQIIVETLVIRTTYGSRLFVKLKRKRCDRSLMKLVFKVGSRKDLELLAVELYSFQILCSLMY